MILIGSDAGLLSADVDRCKVFPDRLGYSDKLYKLLINKALYKINSLFKGRLPVWHLTCFVGRVNKVERRTQEL